MNRPVSATLALAFLLLNAITSLFFGFSVLLRAIPGIPDQSILRFIMAGSAFAGSVLLFVLYLFLVNRNRPAFYIALGVFVLITVLVFADEIGFSDWIAFGLSAMPIVLLLLARKWFLTTRHLD